MKVKRMVKRMFAVGTGVAMLGATAMGALAADLKSYPGMFVDNGVFNGLLVVGDTAKPIDNLAVTDIAAGMKYVKPSATTTVSVEGDAWMVGTSSKSYELANNNATGSSIGGESWRDINTFIGDDELAALSDGTWATNENEYAFQQFMFFDADSVNNERNRIVKYDENDKDVSADHLFLGNGKQIARYKLEFSSTAQSDVTDSAGSADTTGTYLDDFENTELSMLGKPYKVVLARRPASGPQGGGGSIKLTLMAGAARDTLLEGETQTYTVGDKTYEVTLTFVDADEGLFTVNGEKTNKLKVGETYVLSDKSEVGVSEVLYQDYAGGVHSVTFFVGASKMELRDDDIGDATGAYNVKVGSEDIDGTTVIVTGTDDNSTFTVSTVEVNMTAEDDFFVSTEGKLSDVITAAGEEKEVLMAGSFDIEYKGLTDEKTHDLQLKTSSSRRYKLVLFDGDGKAVDIPVAYAESATNLSAGEDTQVGATRNNWKALKLNETANNVNGVDITSIHKDDYFIVTGGTAGDGSAKSYLLQYKGADRQSKSSPKIKLKNLGSAETLEYSVTTVAAGTTGTVATIKLGGYSFLVQNASSAQADDFNIAVDMDGSGAVSTAAAPGSLITFVDSFGSQWTPGGGDGPYSGQNGSQVGTDNSSGGSGANFGLVWNMTTPNADDFDQVTPSAISLNISATTGPEVRAALSGVTLLTPDGETEVSYGYTSMGTWIKFSEPSGDPDELTLGYPEKQKLPQVYFTSGATTTTSTAAGDLTTVEGVVGASKLASEVTDTKAQNLILVGGPCVNTIAAELLGNPTDCAEGFRPGVARVKLFEHANGNVAMLVAGYSGEDTRLAGLVVAKRWTDANFKGMEVEVEGTTYSDATIGAPTVKTEAVVEETTTEETTTE